MIENKCFDLVFYTDPSYPKSYNPDQHIVSFTDQEASRLLKESCPALFLYHHKAQLKRIKSRISPDKLYARKNYSPITSNNKKAKKLPFPSSLYEPLIKKSKKKNKNNFLPIQPAPSIPVEIEPINLTAEDLEQLDLFLNKN